MASLYSQAEQPPAGEISPSNEKAAKFSGNVSKLKNVKILDMLKKHLPVLIMLLAIVVVSYQLREIPNRFGILPDIDTYYIYRLNEYILQHDFQLPEKDVLRNYPYGDTLFDRRGALYIPPTVYIILNPILNISFFQFAFIYPSMMGALAVLIMFFVCKELFKSKKAGLFSALFLGTVTAFFTRTSTGEIEKEAISAPFMFLTFLFFIISFREGRWRRGLVYGILSGIFLGLTGSAWGGVQIVLFLYAIFALVLLVFNQNIKNLAVSYLPTVFIGIAILWSTPAASGALLTDIVPLGIASILIIRLAAERFRLLEEKSLKFIPIAIMVMFLIAVLIGSVFIDSLNYTLNQAIDIITFKNVQATTVAESIPGDWNSIYVSTAVVYTSLPNAAYLNLLFSIWTFFFLGSIVLLWMLYKTKDTLMLLPLIFLTMSIFSVFGLGIRFTYMIGVPAAMVAGLFLSWLLNNAFRIKTIGAGKAWMLFIIFGAAALVGAYTTSANPVIPYGFLASGLILLLLSVLDRYSDKSSRLKAIHNRMASGLRHGRFDIILIPIVIFACLTVALNIENARAYSNALGPSINQPFLEAMEYLRTQTPEGSSVFSWWDFGYWFQTVGERPTILDGGGAGAISRYDAALFFTDNPDNWDNWSPNLISNVSYILMDYTLPGKYGAITKIASNGHQVVGFIQFDPRPSIVQSRDNITIYEYSAPPYALWLPSRSTEESGIVLADSPLLLQSENGQYVSQSYINDVCTTGGIIRAANRTDSIGGCVSISQQGIFYIPPVAEHTIFSRLMFMEGVGLPLEKVFDNRFIQIYKVE